MKKELKSVILIYDDEIMIAEGEEAKKYDDIVTSAAVILHGRAYNPFSEKGVNWIKATPFSEKGINWIETSPDAHAWWKKLKNDLVSKKTSKNDIFDDAETRINRGEDGWG